MMAKLSKTPDIPTVNLAVAAKALSVFNAVDGKAMTSKARYACVKWLPNLME
tara:strand:+ start:55 stop:210 length:156 start_codon:yes stop_codon:yes gene_type:complete